MRRGNRYSNAKKERMVMIASAAFVLAALTMTGVYVKYSSEEEKNDGYHIDFSSLEKQQSEEIVPEDILSYNDPLQNNIISEDALDYTLPLEEADSGKVKIPGIVLPKEDTGDLEDKAADREESDRLADEAAMAADAKKEQEAEKEKKQEKNEKEELTLQQEAETASESQVMTPQVVYSVSAGENLIWPVNGRVLIDYSMDSTVYFPTLSQYKRNPGIVMEAAEGTAITANASGVVTEVFYDEELGSGVKVDIGRGYTAIFGQLKEIQVQEGSVISMGDVLGYIAQPTKYYSVEGTNAYFALEKDGNPVSPFGTLE